MASDIHVRYFLFLGMFTFAEEVYRPEFELCTPVDPIEGLFVLARFFHFESGHVKLEHNQVTSDKLVDGIWVHITLGPQYLSGIEALLKRFYLHNGGCK
jgi:hypothetical protein